MYGFRQLGQNTRLHPQCCLQPLVSSQNGCWTNVNKSWTKYHKHLGARRNCILKFSTRWRDRDGNRSGPGRGRGRAAVPSKFLHTEHQPPSEFLSSWHQSQLQLCSRAFSQHQGCEHWRFWGQNKVPKRDRIVCKEEIYSQNQVLFWKKILQWPRRNGCWWSC